MKREQGLKARVAKVLEDSGQKAWTMGEIMTALEFDKTFAPEVSSALYKLRNQGLVRTLRGPSTSPRGPAFVRRYVWAGRVAKTQTQIVISPLAGLGVMRG